MVDPTDPVNQTWQIAATEMHRPPERRTCVDQNCGLEPLSAAKHRQSRVRNSTMAGLSGERVAGHAILVGRVSEELEVLSVELQYAGSRGRVPFDFAYKALGAVVLFQRARGNQAGGRSGLGHTCEQAVLISEYLDVAAYEIGLRSKVIVRMKSIALHCVQIRFQPSGEPLVAPVKAPLVTQCVKSELAFKAPHRVADECEFIRKHIIAENIDEIISRKMLRRNLHCRGDSKGEQPQRVMGAKPALNRCSAGPRDMYEKDSLIAEN